MSVVILGLGVVVAVVFLAAVTVFVWQWRVMRRKYVPLFKDGHLFGEIPSCLAALKHEAFTRAGQPLTIPNDSRLFLTSAGLAIIYTVEERPQGLVNQISMSYSGTPIAFAFGGHCGYLILTFLGVDVRRIAVAHSEAGVTHLAFIVAPDDRSEFVARSVSVPSRADLRGLRDRATAWKNGLLSGGLLLHDELDLVRALTRAS